MNGLRFRCVIAVLTAVLAASLPGAAAAGDQKPEPHGAVETERVRINDNARFSPRVLTVTRGTRVRWVNNDNLRHTSTSNTGIWESGTLQTGDSFNRIFRQVGTFRYHCRIHPQITGRIVVTA